MTPLARLLVTCGLLWVTFGCGTTYSELNPRECLPAAAELSGEREPDPPRVECGQPHVYEVYAVGRLRGDDYPGADTVDAASLQLCLDALEPSIGVAPADTPAGSEILFIAPTSTSWTRDDDRAVECVLMFATERVGLLGGEANA